ncbi:hypothetical protein evm_013592 [Chilo suppressalis]|nr:hypothetical protein evm_013592 [Chilo suppressalis]
MFTGWQGGEELQPDPGVRFLVEPNDEVVLEGDSVMLSCSAASVHPVSLSWRYSASGIPTRDQAHTSNDQHRKQLLNGSLVIERMSRQLSGQYQCVASVRGVGTILSRPASVLLAELPPLSPGPLVVSGVAGGPTLVPCGVVPPPRVAVRLVTAPPDRRVPNALKTHHAPPTLMLNVTWLRNGAPIPMEAGRVTILPSGSLELEPSRVGDAGIYRCRVALAHRPSTHTLGEEIELRISTDLMAEYPPRFVATPQSCTVIEGASVTFDCAAVGNPKPEITWLKDGVEIDLNALDWRRFRVGWGSLSTRARGTDAGYYTCRAHSALDSADAVAMLTVMVSPRASSPASVVIAQARGVALLPCNVRGRPAPTVSWYKDGEPLTPNQHDIVLLDGWSLRIQGVLPMDAGMFQCVAVSAAGAALASTRLLVLPANDLNSNVSSASKSSVFFHKNKSSTYKKTSPSYKNSTTQDIFNSLISSDHFDDQNTDNSLEDSDFLGETSSAFTSGPELEYDYNYDANQVDDSDNSFHAAKGLDLDQLKSVNATVISPPKNLRAVIVKHRFVTLSWEEPDVKKEEITGYAVIYKVKGSEREQISLGSGGRREMNVASLQPNTTYMFRVTAHSDVSRSMPTADIEVSTPGDQSTSGAARNVWAASISPRAARVSWAPPALPVPRPTQYRLMYTDIDTGVEQTQLVDIDTNQESYNATLTGLRPAGTYSLRVIVGGEGEGRSEGEGRADGAVEGSEPIRFKTPGDAPSAPPVNVTAVATGANIRVCALNANGSGPFSEWVSVSTPRRPRHRDSVPPQPPPLTTRAGRDWISVWWSGEGEGEGVAGEGEEVEGGWVLGWGMGVPDTVSKELPPGTHSHVIRGLESNAEYVISLRGSNALGLGPAVYATVRTRAAPLHDNGDELDDADEADEFDEDDEVAEMQPELLPPVGLKVIMLSGTTAVVYWTDPTLPKGQTATDGRRYVVRWATAGSRPRTYNATDLNCMIDELKPNTHYEFAVKLIRGGRESQWSMLVSNTTLEAPPASPPRDLRVAPPPAPSSPARSVDLVWAAPAKPNGAITVADSSPETRDRKFSITHPMTDHCESCLTSTIAAERANHPRYRAPQSNSSLINIPLQLLILML